MSSTDSEWSASRLERSAKVEGDGPRASAPKDAHKSDTSKTSSTEDRASVEVEPMYRSSLSTPNKDPAQNAPLSQNGDQPESYAIKDGTTVRGEAPNEALSPTSEKKRNGNILHAARNPAKRRRTSPGPDAMELEVSRPTSSTTSDQSANIFDNQSWTGYCEIESEPAYLSNILRRIGIQGVTVRELFMLDQESIFVQPSPIFGLVLLFRHRKFDEAEQEKTCPSDVWFANQMPGQNSCATLAMLHTILNIPESAVIDVGERVRQFKDYSRELDPVHRGEAFASWQYVKQIHNSFAKRMDILENDMYVANRARKAALAAAAETKPKPRPKNKGTKSRSRQQREPSVESDDSSNSFEGNSHHYVAFAPVAGTVYKLDGMDAQPTQMGTYDPAYPETWIYSFSDRLEAILASGGDDYGIFALAQSPLVDLRGRICAIDNTCRVIDSHLTSIDPDWRSRIPATDLEPLSSRLSAIPTEKLREEHVVPASVATAIAPEVASGDSDALLQRRAALIVELRGLADEYLAEEARETQEDEKAEARKWDYSPAIQRWLEMLAENRWLEARLDSFMPKKGK